MIHKLPALVCVALLAVAVAGADTLTMKDGTRHEGKFVSATTTTVTFREGKLLHHYPRTSIQSLDLGTTSTTSGTTEAGESGPELSRRNSAAPIRPLGKSATLPAGTEIAVMTNETIDSSTANQGQVFPADIAENVVDSAGRVVIPKGSQAQLVLRNLSTGGITGSREMTIDLESVRVGDRRYMVNAADVQQKGSDGIGANRRTAEMTGGGAVLGTLIGAIAGGGKGAAIGALGGAAAGAGAQILTRGKTVKVPAESVLRFKLDQPLQLNAAY